MYLLKIKITENFQKSLLNIHHADIAEIITNLSDFESQFLYENLHDETAALVLKEVEDEKEKTLLSKLSAKEIAVDVIDNLESDDAVDVILDLSEKRKKKYYHISKMKIMLTIYLTYLNMKKIQLEA